MDTEGPTWGRVARCACLGVAYCDQGRNTPRCEPSGVGHDKDRLVTRFQRHFPSESSLVVTEGVVRDIDARLRSVRLHGNELETTQAQNDETYRKYGEPEGRGTP